MNEKRLRKRGIKFYNKFAGKLLGYKLVFQEFLEDENNNVYANIIPSEKAVVEGIIYLVDDTVKKLNKYECVPVDYLKKTKKVLAPKGFIDCIVYMGNKDNLGQIKKPSADYLQHLLKGEEFLSKGYFEFLRKNL